MSLKQKIRWLLVLTLIEIASADVSTRINFFPSVKWVMVSTMIAIVPALYCWRLFLSLVEADYVNPFGKIISRSTQIAAAMIVPLVLSIAGSVSICLMGGALFTLALGKPFSETTEGVTELMTHSHRYSEPTQELYIRLVESPNYWGRELLIPSSMHITGNTHVKIFVAAKRSFAGELIRSFSVQNS